MADGPDVIGDEFPAVLAAAKAGGDEALERLYRSCVRSVRGYLRSNLVRDADDVTSEVFVSMLKGLPSFDGDERSFRSWLLTIAHHRMVDAVRRSRRRLEDPTDPQVAWDFCDGLLDAEQSALDRLERSGLLATIEQLTPDQRATLMLRVLGDLTVAEIAVVLQKPESAVKGLLRRGIASLRRTLAAGEPERMEQVRPFSPVASGRTCQLDGVE